MKRTDNYFATIQLMDGKPATESDKLLMEHLRSTVKKMNRLEKTKHYVKLHGRGHRYGNQSWAQELPLKYATSADVYIYERKTF